MISHPLTKYPEIALRVIPSYGVTVAQFAVMSMYGSIVFDTDAPYDKRDKPIHRMAVGGANGLQRLTVPLVKPDHLTGLTVGRLNISDHGEWWNVHWGAIESAYGRSPYFEYYAPELQPLFSAPQGRLVDLNIALHRFCCRVLGLDHLLGSEGSAAESVSVCDMKGMPLPDVIPYYQVWAQRFGFMADLSILDLVFNLGTEAPLYLRRL